MITDHLETTTNSRASRRLAAVIAYLSPEPYQTCCSRQSKNHLANAPQDQHTKTITVFVENLNMMAKAND